jgi:hypothetical protein
MSINLPGVAKTEFDDEVKHVYQGMQTLRSTVRTRNNVVGEAYKFRRMGKGTANQKAIQSLVTPMNVGHDLFTATLEDWLAPEYTDIFAQQEVNFDEKMELAQTIGKALGRRDDQIVLDELANANYGSTGVLPPTADDAYFFDGAAAALDMGTIHKFREIFQSQACMDETTLVITAHGLQAILQIAVATSSDYVGPLERLISGEMKGKFLGFDWKIMDIRDEGGLPNATDGADGTRVETMYAYAKPAIGVAVGLDIRTSIDWVPERTSWLCNGLLKAGAVVIEDRAICKATYKSVAP